MTTLLFLLDRPRELTRAELARAASRAFGCHVDPVEADPTRTDGIVAGEAPALVLAVRGRVVLVHSRARAYFPDGSEIARRSADPRVARAIERHSGWFSLDLVECRQPLAPRVAMAELGVLAAHLIEGDLLALGIADDGVLRVADEGTVERLRAGRGFAPIANAVRESRMGTDLARARWPEFVAAFRAKRSHRAEFAVCVTCEHGHTGWLIVDAVETGFVWAHVEGDDEKLAVPEREIVDWLIQDGDELRGGFTLEGAEPGGDG